MTTKQIVFQLYSDIHIESWNKLPELPVKSKYLILAGDICQFNHNLFFKFLDYCSVHWEKTFYIPGNHEYYSLKKNMDELEFEYKYFISKRYKNVFYLNNSFTSLNEEINIYGTTFWTEPPFLVSGKQIKYYINDYSNIQYFNNSSNRVVDLDSCKIRQLSNDSFNQLQEYLNETTKKTMIITHFPPTRNGTSDPKYSITNPLIQSYFSWPNDTLSKLNLKNVLTWISGHTHWSYDFQQDGIRLISNQLGYKSEIGKTGIDEDGLYEINVS